MGFNDRLRALREEKNLSAAQLAGAFGKSEGAVRMWETGRSKPDVDTLIKLAEYFDCTTDYLLGLSDIRNAEVLSLIEDSEKALFNLLSQTSDSNSIFLYEAFSDAVKGFLSLTVSPQLKHAYWNTLISMLRNLSEFPRLIPTLYEIQKEGTAVENYDKILKVIQTAPGLILDASHSIQVSLTDITSRFIGVIDFMCYGKINGEKAVKTTMSEMLDEINRIKQHTDVDPATTTEQSEDTCK